MHMRGVGVLLMAITTATAASAQTQVADKRSIYTFNNSVELPGVTLPAGQYVFRLADPDGGRQVLQVLNSEGKVFGMFFSMPIQRAEPADTAEATLMEAPAGTPRPIRAVWYPGERTGREFIYPRSRAMEIAKTEKQPILTTAGPSSSSAQTRTGDLARVSSDGRDVPFNDKDSAAANAATTPTRPESTPVARVNEPRSPVGTSGQSPAPAPRVARTRLPSTASNTPGLLFAGLGLIGVAIAVRARRLSRG